MKKYLLTISAACLGFDRPHRDRLISFNLVHGSPAKHVITVEFVVKALGIGAMCSTRGSETSWQF